MRKFILHVHLDHEILRRLEVAREVEVELGLVLRQQLVVLELVRLLVLREDVARIADHGARRVPPPLLDLLRSIPARVRVEFVRRGDERIARRRRRTAGS